MLNQRDTIAILVVLTIGLALALLIVTRALIRRSRQRVAAAAAETWDLIAHASDGIFIADREGVFSSVNSAGCALLGVTEREIVGRNFRDFTAPDELGRVADARTRLLNGETQLAEGHLRHKSGRFIPVEVSSKLLPGGIWQALVRDISKRKAAEEQARRLEVELRDARGFLENVLQSSIRYGLIALDLQRRILFWNEGARRMFGYSATEALGMRADALHVAGDIDSGVALALYARALEQGSAEATLRRRRQHGSEFLSRLVVTRRTLQDGTPIGYLLVSRDVTREERDAQYERLLAAIGLLLTSSLERQQLVEDAAELLVREFADACMVDIAEPPVRNAEPTTWRSRVVHRDPRKRRLTEALEKIRREGLAPYFASAPVASRRTTVVSHVTTEFLDTLARSDEHRRLMHDLAPTSLISVPLQVRGLLLGVITFVSSDAGRCYDESDARFVEDIGERLAFAVDHARLYAAANSAVAARDEVMRVVAHDLRNPLGSILMQASSLRDAKQGGHPAHERGEAIERAARRMNRLIQDLLDVTQLEASSLSVNPAAVAPATIIADSIEAHSELASHLSIALRGDASDELPNAWCDRDRMLQIFENLIGNATKFTAAGGSIVVGAEQHGGEVQFWVRDTGRGISADDLPHVFERFWRRSGDKASGAGLGLPIVKGLVEAQGGRVSVQSAPGRGSTFFVAMPAARETKTAEKQKPAA